MGGRVNFSQLREGERENKREGVGARRVGGSVAPWQYADKREEEHGETTTWCWHATAAHACGADGRGWRRAGERSACDSGVDTNGDGEGEYAG